MPVEVAKEVLVSTQSHGGGERKTSCGIALETSSADGEGRYLCTTPKS